MDIWSLREGAEADEGLTTTAKDVLRLLKEFGTQYGYSVSQISFWFGFSRRKARRILKQLEKRNMLFRK